MNDLQKRAQQFIARLKAAQLRGNTPPSELGIREEIADFIGELVAEVERLQQDWEDALNVTSKDGLLSSEWIARTGAAERRAEAAEAKLEKAELLIAGLIFCGAGDDAIIGEIRAAGLDIQTRLKAAEAKVKQLSDALDKQALLTAAFNEDADIAKAKLRAVEGLPEKLQAGKWWLTAAECAAELEAVLRINEGDER